MTKRTVTFTVLCIGLLGQPIATRANGFGLQIADEAGAMERGLIRVVAGATVGEEERFYGARLAYALKDSLAVFVDVGMVDPSRGTAEGNVGVQLGAMYALPVIMVRVPLDFAARLTVFKPFIEQVEIVGGTATVVTSYDLDRFADGLSAYLGLGANYLSWSVDMPWGTNDGNDVDPYVSAGALYRLNTRFSAFAELSYIEDLYGSAGVRVDF